MFFPSEIDPRGSRSGSGSGYPPGNQETSWGSPAEACLLEELIISARYEEKNYWRDLWRYRELLYFLAWRDILVRYKQTIVGIAWAFVRPVLSIVIFTFVFHQVAGLSSTVPYALMVCAGMLPWGLFASAFTDAGNSLVGNSNLISKIYFPRLLIPMSTLAVGFVDLVISLLLLGGLLAWFHYLPDARMVTLPLFIVLALTSSLGAGLWIAALTVQYRDFRFIAPFLVQIGIYITPVGFSSEKITGGWRLAYSLNPMVGVIDGFRWAIFGSAAPLYGPGLLISVVASLSLLYTAIRYFRRTEKSFADAI